MEDRLIRRRRVTYTEEVDEELERFASQQIARRRRWILIGVCAAVGVVAAAVAGVVSYRQAAEAERETTWRDGQDATLAALCRADRAVDRDELSHFDGGLSEVLGGEPVPTDVLGQPLFLVTGLSTGPTPYVICSPGLDGAAETEDDVCIGAWYGSDVWHSHTQWAHGWHGGSPDSTKAGLGAATGWPGCKRLLKTR